MSRAVIASDAGQAQRTARANALDPLGQREDPFVLRPVRAADEVARVELQDLQRVVGHKCAAEQARTFRAERVRGQAYGTRRQNEKIRM
ncbi:hypothetical protein ON010_g13947 [Phytophthora cinnamomi]|nr:hypothetical protein ON010_g13947 [Phytophthora cinnamomi]